jgi:hypothetical protein
MSTDIRDAIERSIGDGPEPPEPELLLVHGRRALRRRRLVEAGSAVAASAAVVTVMVLGARGTTEGAAPRPVDPASATATTRAGEPTGIPSTAVTAPRFPAPDAPVVTDPRVPSDWPVMQKPDGVHVSPRVQVVRFEDDPWGLRPKAWSVAVIYRLHGVTYWYAGYIDATYGGASASIPAANAGLPFDDWVQEQDEVDRSGAGGGRPSAPATPDGGWPGMTDLQLVRFDGASERLTPLDAVTLLQQRPHPDLPASWARPGDRSAVAEVRFEGVRYYVLARTMGEGAPQYVAVKAADGGATLDDFLDLARHRYASGGGGLL